MKLSVIISLILAAALSAALFVLFAIVKPDLADRKAQVEAVLEAGRIASINCGRWNVAAMSAYGSKAYIRGVVVYQMPNDPREIKKTKGDPEWEKFQTIRTGGRVRFGIRDLDKTPKSISTNPGDYLTILEVEEPSS